MKIRFAGLALVVVLGLAGCARSDAPTPTGPQIVAVVEDFNWYPPCATNPIEIEGDLYYPLPWGAPPVDESKYPLPTPTVAALAVSIDLGLPRVVPPGPGDDIGTVILYSDGMARFESESGNVAWLTREEQQYGYVC